MIRYVRRKLANLLDSFARFPATMVFLFVAAILNAIDISRGVDLSKAILTCAVGAVACAAGQSVYERFLSSHIRRVLMTAAGLAVTVLFYLSVRALPKSGNELLIRFIVTGLALFIAFIWLGVVRSRYSFSESFMAAFKALCQAGFFSGVLFLGCVAIVAAVNALITPVGAHAYIQTANIAFIVIAPIILLSLIPVYPGRLESGDARDEIRASLIEKRITSPKFLEVLLSYIIVPLTSVFTAILLVYILLNIGGRFWTNNLLEPLLISYTITVIVITLLVSGLGNRLAVLFRAIFPKLLIPVALFQTAASLLIMADTGVTYRRYFVILYGIFALFSGVVLSFGPVRRSGLVALALVALSAVSLIPPVDAFTVSRNSQAAVLENTLLKNNMLRSGAVTPNGSIQDADKTKIINSVRYLTDMNALDAVGWLPANFSVYDDAAFFETFGFHMYTPATPGYRYVSVSLDMTDIIPVAGYDVMKQLNVPNADKSGQPGPGVFEAGGKTYSLLAEGAAGNFAVILKDSAGTVLCRFETKDLYARYASYPSDNNLLTPDAATFTTENDRAAMKIIVLNAGFTDAPGSTDGNAQLLVLAKIK